MLIAAAVIFAPGPEERFDEVSVHAALSLQPAALEVKSRQGPRSQPDTHGDVVARGEADLAIQPMPELMSVSGVDVVGPFPADLQSHAVLTGGVSASATDEARDEAFLAFLKKPPAAAVIRQKGLEPQLILAGHALTRSDDFPSRSGADQKHGQHREC